MRDLFEEPERDVIGFYRDGKFSINPDHSDPLIKPDPLGQPLRKPNPPPMRTEIKGAPAWMFWVFFLTVFSLIVLWGWLWLGKYF